MRNARPAAVVLDRAAAREDRVVLVQEHRVVDLEQEAGVDDPPVLLVQGVRDREDELLLGRVVLVAQPVHARGRDDRQERVDDVDAGECALEARDVALERRGVVADRPRAEPALRLEPASPGARRTRFETSRVNAASCSA